MAQHNEEPILLFSSDWTEMDDIETPSKGYRGDCRVQLPDKRIFSVCFYDPIRLQQDLEYEKIIAEVGLIVIEEVTKIKMQEAVVKLWKLGYFENFKGLDSKRNKN